MAAFRTSLRFFVAAFGFSWLVWLPLAADTAGWIEVPGSHFHLGQIGAFGPSLAALLLAGRDRKALLKRAAQWRANPLLYLAALFGPAAYMTGGRLIHAWLGGAPAPNPPVSPGVIITTYIFVLLYGGPVQQEFGWRGYALPRLQAQLGFWRAAFALGAAWALWQLPLCFVRGSAQYGTSFAVLVLTGIGLSVLAGWIYNASHGSVLLALLAHAGANTAANFVLNWPVRGPGTGPFLWTCALVAATVATVVMHSRRSRRRMAA
ncbi:MAG TPA: CPBP family glutamic-type intramembrane protease [Symbiobacteriaceae bacterium]|nr:CPBP family glutamic-type intramembrane protease [Symbiobacteriaceae bacterium]